MDYRKLVELAYEAQERAYTPYSKFQVGAALLGKSGKVYLGCNIENAAYTPTNCAERTAFFKAVSEGEREFLAIAIVGNQQDAKMDECNFCAPCGVCRQVMMEFCDPDTFQVVLGVKGQDYRAYVLRELLPLGFGPADLESSERK